MVTLVEPGEERAPFNLRSGLEDKGIVVTGAAGGIGRVVAAAFADVDARVCAVDTEEESVYEVVRGLHNPNRHLAAVVDFNDLESHEPLLRHAFESFGSFYVLAHCASVHRRRPDVDSVTEEDWDRQVDVNMKATFFLNRMAARLFKQGGRGGRIINFVSQLWSTGALGGSVVYAATNGGVVSLTRSLARTFAPDGITVNAVAPGIPDSPGAAAEQIQAYVRTIPIGRMARPEEVASAVLFLASDHAAFITGETLNVSGGQVMY
jgi:NAD(P)-dependent dehydrogenase (short-subunit alcohol dehydrogenase family)